MSAAFPSAVRVELTRYRSHRGVMALALVAVILSAAFAIKVGYDTRRYTEGEIATARAQAQIAAQDESTQVQLEACQKAPTSYLGQDGTAAECSSLILPKTADFLERSPLRLSREIGSDGLRVASLVVLLLVIGAAAFAGPDWDSRTITHQALVDPRRLRLWSAKAAAVALATLIAAVLSMAAFWLPLRVAAAQRGLSVTHSGAVLEHVLRVLALAVVAAVVAYALTMVFRRAVTTVAIILGIGLAAEILLRLLPLTGTGWMSPTYLVSAWLTGKVSYLDPSLTCAGVDCDRLRLLTLWPAGGVIAVVALVVAIGSATQFRVRDLP